MNEIIFIMHAVSIASFTLLACVMGSQALCAAICLQHILANLFITKQITLFGFDTVCGDVFIIGSLFGLNLLQEYFGKKTAQKTVLVSFCTVLFYLLMLSLQCAYQPNSFDTMHSFFCLLRESNIRVVCASVVVFLIVQFIDTLFFGFLTRLLGHRFLTLRTACSMIIMQSLDTVLFSFAALYGTVGNIGHVIMLSICVKCISIALISPFSLLSKKIIRNENNHDNT